MNVRGFRKELETMKSGDKFYFNSIAGSVAMIELLREKIKAGIIAPDEEALNKTIVKEAQDKFRNGDCIAPQMDYIVK